MLKTTSKKSQVFLRDNLKNSNQVIKLTRVTEYNLIPAIKDHLEKLSMTVHC